MTKTIGGRALVPGSAEGPLLHADVGLSFWGGVDPRTGQVVDRHHPLAGARLAGCVLAIPSGRGSCSGSGVLLQLILDGQAPAAIVVCDAEEILTLGALVAAEMFSRDLPILRIDPDAFASLRADRYARLDGEHLHLFEAAPQDGWQPPDERVVAPAPPLALEPIDQALLDGHHGEAAATAMRLLVRMAALQGADRLMDIGQVHVDGCVYTGPATLRFATQLLDGGARVRVPTTLNAISVDQRRWRDQGVPEAFGAPAQALADAYVAMGARPTFTCAPYLLPGAPTFGEHVGWAESNAVVYANSVIGARTMKYPDYLDICMALTGRAPLAGCHVETGRRATLAIAVTYPAGADDAFWPLAGYCCGLVCGSAIPLISGLEHSGAGPDDLKAFGAAFATTAAAPMFHMAGITPEAAQQAPERIVSVGIAELRRAWTALNTGDVAAIGLVSLGSPHLSADECARLAGLVQGRIRRPDVPVIVTCGREVLLAASAAGHVAAAEAFGVAFVTDTCWCMLQEPIVPAGARTLMTNSGKYAHYAPGLVGRTVRFGSMAACIEAACSGETSPHPPGWLDAKAV